MKNSLKRIRLLKFLSIYSLSVFLFISVLNAGIAADINKDFYVDFEDLLMLVDYWLSCLPADCPADIDGDDDVDIYDLAGLSDSYGLTSIITATASSQESPGYPPSNAVDGNFATRWSSQFQDNQYLQLDLGYQRPVDSLEIHWENAYAEEYEVLISTDSTNWTSVYSTTSGNGGIDNIAFPPQSIKYIKINCIKRATQWGSSIYEVVVKPDNGFFDSLWTLIWEDNFNAFNPTRWEKATHTWDENLAQFVTENVTFADGIMTLHLTDEPAGTKDYSGAEYRTKDSYLYGKFVVKMKGAPGSGVISSFFTYRDPPTDPTWNEIDIEFLGKDTTIIQFNPWWGWWPDCDPQVFDLPFDAAVEFHEYTFEWLPDYIRWTVDGDTYHVFRDNVPWLAQKIMMNIWISSNTDWAGPFNPAILPTQAHYDYVKYYEPAP